MEDVRRPCEHRGTDHVLTTKVGSADVTVDFAICKECRRFWLERDGWLLSRREALNVLKNWPVPESLAR